MSEQILSLMFPLSLPTLLIVHAARRKNRFSTSPEPDESFAGIAAMFSLATICGILA